MTKIIFSFDTEDYVNKEAADAILNIANIMQEEGVVGCFNVVGRMAEALVKWGRQDVIEALKHHEINNHSLGHSYHPTVCEYTDLESFDEAMSNFMKEEKETNRILSETFGVDHFPASVAAGSNNSYVAHYGYAMLGSRVYPGDRNAGIFIGDQKTGRPTSCMNIWTTDYNEMLEWFLIENDEEGLIKRLNEIKTFKDLHVFANHPGRVMYEEFWDKLNFDGKNTPEEEWVGSTPYSQEHIDTFYKNFRFLIRAIKNDPQFCITTFEDLSTQLDSICDRTITLQQIPNIKAQLEEYFFPVTLPDSYCLTDIFRAAQHLLSGKKEYRCGFVYGFLEEPFVSENGTTVTREDMVASAKSFSVEGWLPEKIQVGDVTLGPAEWLMAALDILCGSETADVTPRCWQVDLEQFPMLKHIRYANTWVYWDKLKDDHLSRRFKTQTWTFRLPKGTHRKIY